MDNDPLGLLTDTEGEQRIPIRRKRPPFTMIENKIIDDIRVSKTGVIIFVVMCKHSDWNGGSCFPSIKTICRETRSTKKTVIKGIRELEKFHYLIKEQRRDPNNPKKYLSNIYTITGEGEEERQGVVEKNPKGSVKEPQGGSVKGYQERYPSFELDTLNDNVTLEIVSLFESFKIPKKDRTIWMSKYKNDKEYLLKQLQYAAKQDSINNPVRWIQSALDGDFASSDSEEIEQRERQAVIDKGRENHEAKGIDREVNNMIPGDTEGGRYAETQDTKKTLNGFLMKYKAYPEITAKCREVLKYLQEGGDGEKAVDMMFKELAPLIKEIQGTRQPVKV